MACVRWLDKGKVGKVAKRSGTLTDDYCNWLSGVTKGMLSWIGMIVR